MIVGIVDYGVGNIGSVRTLLKNLKLDSMLVASSDSFSACDALILPGVGRFDFAMMRLKERALIDPIIEFANSGKPMIGICLGMQLLGSFSEEGNVEGLNLIPGKVRKFTHDLRSPHMGWNLVDFVNIELPPEHIPRYYFVHSYYFEPTQKKHILGRTDYGLNFASAIQLENIYGLQFHPEKSHFYGRELIQSILGC